MPGLVPGIHEFSAEIEDVDGRDKPGHDGAGLLLDRGTSALGG
jgi:2-oxoglutarate ferredoxin oxidoreductase subunit beta